MPGKSLMIQGTMSSTGKSLLVTALCRIFARRGLHVAPFKSQNMSNNAAVCADGSEIGRAQFTQALACGIEPRAVMNPILLKPEADTRSQVIVMGKPYANLSARNYYKHKPYLWKVVTAALNSIREEYDLVIIEGAGSPVELNLKQGDMVNMAVAKYAQAPVLLIGDIDRGGIFAQLLGTLWLLDPEERELVKGLVVNKFRGDITLFHDGIRMLEEMGKVPVIGVVPYIHHQIPEEDAVAIEAQNATPIAVDQIDLVVVRLPRISNFDDFDLLRDEQGVSIRYVDVPQDFGNPNAVIIPGTKSTIADLNWLREQGLHETIQNFAHKNGCVVGICGGYQMLGEVVRNPDAVEAPAGEVTGLGLLPTETVFNREKVTHQIQAVIRNNQVWLGKLCDTVITGYEIHIGTTKLINGEAWLEITTRSGQPASVHDGAVSPDGRVWGCYIHGIFNNEEFRHTWLTSLGWKGKGQSSNFPIPLNAAIDNLADKIEKALDLEYLDELLGY